MCGTRGQRPKLHDVTKQYIILLHSHRVRSSSEGEIHSARHDSERSVPRALPRHKTSPVAPARRGPATASANRRECQAAPISPPMRLVPTARLRRTPRPKHRLRGRSNEHHFGRLQVTSVAACACVLVTAVYPSAVYAFLKAGLQFVGPQVCVNKKK